MNIVGYGICGPGEAQRYMRQTLDEFKRLCDYTIILVNGNLRTCKDEIKLINEYGFDYVFDKREWGTNQWLIKQEFLDKHVRRYEPDFCVCLDMDEVFCKHLTREWIEQSSLDAYYVYVVDLWNDEEHYKPESCFWNVRLFRWNGDIRFKEKPVHCGLAPEWTYFYHRHAPFMLKHYGLMRKEDRDKRITRYEKYDPQAKHLGRVYYDMLASDKAKPFIESELCSKIEKEVASYKQSKPKPKMATKKQRFAYLENPGGVTVDVPERDVAQTLKRKGFKFLHWSDEEIKKEPVYQKSTEEIKAQEIVAEQNDESALPVVNEEEKPVDKVVKKSRVSALKKKK